MTETRPGYVAGAEEKPITCGNHECNALIGVQIECGGKKYLRIGGATLHHAHGQCTVCGWPYHWATTDRQLDDLIDSIVVRRRRA